MHDEASKVVFNSPRRWETTSHSKGQACANSNTSKTITIKISMASMSVMAGPTHTAQGTAALHGAFISDGNRVQKQLIVRS